MKLHKKNIVDIIFKKVILLNIIFLCLITPALPYEIQTQEIIIKGDGRMIVSRDASAKKTLVGTVSGKVKVTIKGTNKEHVLTTGEARVFNTGGLIGIPTNEDYEKLSKSASFMKVKITEPTLSKNSVSFSETITFTVVAGQEYRIHDVKPKISDIKIEDDDDNTKKKITASFPSTAKLQTRRKASGQAKESPWTTGIKITFTQDNFHRDQFFPIEITNMAKLNDIVWDQEINLKDQISNPYPTP